MRRPVPERPPLDEARQYLRALNDPDIKWLGAAPPPKTMTALRRACLAWLKVTDPDTERPLQRRHYVRYMGREEISPIDDYVLTDYYAAAAVLAIADNWVALGQAERARLAAVERKRFDATIGNNDLALRQEHKRARRQLRRALVCLKDCEQFVLAGETQYAASAELDAAKWIGQVT